MNTKVLFFFDKLKPLFEKMGINYTVMRSILYIKLLMDGRKVPTILINNRKNYDKDNSNKFLKSLWIYVFMGLVLIPFIIMKGNYLFQMSIVFSIIMFFIMASLISDFSAVLLDTRDRNIIGTRPVDPKTLRMAKTIHIFIYLFFISAALVGPSLIVSLFTQGILFFAVYLLSTILIDIFIIVLTSLIYLVVLRLFDGEKLKDIINYIQIILSIVIMAGYQLVSRVFYVFNMKLEFTPAWWHYLLPPVWFSAPFQMIKNGEINRDLITFTAMAVFIPVLTIAFYIRMMPLIEQYLQKLSNAAANKKKARIKLTYRISRLLCRKKEEQIFYRFAADMMKNERSFKLKVYPSLGFSLIIPFIMLLSFVSGDELKGTLPWKYFLTIYFCGLMIPTITMMVRCSESYKASWIYKALPVENYGNLFKGTMKAYIVRLFTPLFLLESILFTVLLGIKIVPYLIVVFINMMIYNIICFLALNKTLPFSQSFETIQQPNTVIMLILFFIPGVFAWSQYMLMKISYGTYINMLISLAVNLMLWKTAYIKPVNNPRQEL